MLKLVFRKFSDEQTLFLQIPFSNKEMFEAFYLVQGLKPDIWEEMSLGAAKESV